MKAGIFTIVDYRNYGNRLQNYALQEFLKSMGMEVETVLHDDYYDYKYTDKYIMNLPKHLLKSVLWRVIDIFAHDKHAMGYIWQSDILDKERIKKNIALTNKYIEESNYIVREGNKKEKKLNQYDYCIAGSDQIWNPTLPGNASDFYFLQNVPFEKRIAFAASVACDDIPDDRKKQWIKYVGEMNYISVREKKAQLLIKKYTGKKSEKILDPTLLIDVNKYYRMMESHPTELPEKYIATYVLGEFDGEQDKALKKMADINDCEIIQLNNKKYRDTYLFDFIDFLNCINQAKFVITDSFHACVFSILFSKPFAVIKRKGKYGDMYSRIDDLLETFGLENHACDSINTDMRLDSLNKEFIDQTIAIEKHKAIEYIYNIIESNN